MSESKHNDHIILYSVDDRVAPSIDDELAHSRSPQPFSNEWIGAHDLEITMDSLEEFARRSRMTACDHFGGRLELALSLVVNLDWFGHTSRATRGGRPRPNA
jgi:hypothetical protein